MKSKRMMNFKKLVPFAAVLLPLIVIAVLIIFWATNWGIGLTPDSTL